MSTNKSPRCLKWRQKHSLFRVSAVSILRSPISTRQQEQHKTKQNKAKQCIRVSMGAVGRQPVGACLMKWGPPRATRCSKPALATTFDGYILACTLIDSYPCYFVLMPVSLSWSTKVSQRSSKCLQAGLLHRTLFLSSLSFPRRMIYMETAIRGRWLW